MTRLPSIASTNHIRLVRVPLSLNSFATGGMMRLRQTLPHLRLQLSPACRNFAVGILGGAFVGKSHRSCRVHRTRSCAAWSFDAGTSNSPIRNRKFLCTDVQQSRPPLFSLFVSLAACGARGGFDVSRTFPGPIPRPDVSYWASGQPSACGAEVAWGRMLMSLAPQVPTGEILTQLE